MRQAKDDDVSGVPNGRLAVDIGGTFTDVVLEHGGARTEAKVLTTQAEPEQGVIEAVRLVLRVGAAARRSAWSSTARRWRPTR